MSRVYYVPPPPRSVLCPPQSALCPLPQSVMMIVPSTKYLISLIRKKHDVLRPWYDNRISLLSAEHLKIDHSHKVTGRIRFKDVKIFSGLFTAMNENNQIRLQIFVFSKSLDEVSPSLSELALTLEKRGEAGIQTVSTDNCCKDRGILQKSISSLGGIDDDQTAKTFPSCTLPSDVTIITIESDHELDQICPIILDAATNQGHIAIGLDAEWNVIGDHGRKKVALVQIAFESHVYLIRLCKIKSLNSQLKDIFLNPNIIKTGKNIGGDLRAIFRDYAPALHQRFQKSKLPGVVELGKLAASSQMVESGKASLDAISKSVLNKRLNKDDFVRLSNWESNDLSDSQSMHAAIDTFASKKIYETLINNEPRRISSSEMVETNQIVHILPTTTSRILGAAKIMSTEHLTPEELHKLNPRRNRVLVQITQVICADAMVGIRGKKVPIEVGKVVWIYANSLCENGEAVLKFQEQRVIQSAKKVQQSVVADGFHILHQFNLPKHPFRKAFFESFREALYVPYEEDMLLVKQKLFPDKEEDFQFLMQCWPEFFAKRIRRRIPKPEILKQRIEKVFMQFKDLVDVDGKRLFQARHFKIMKNVLKHAEKGCYSDDPKIDLYEKIGTDQHGIPVYRCLRGTSIVESIHQKLIQCFSAFEASPTFADAILSCIRHRMNTRAGIRYCGDLSCGHYEQYYIEGIQQVTLELFGAPMHPSWKNSEDWISNKERFGLVPGNYPESSFQLIDSSISCDSEELNRLKKAFNLHFPFLPVHSDAEHKLFKACMTDNMNEQEIIEEFAKKTNGKDIFPKLQSHIEKHIKTWKEYGRNSVLQNNVSKSIKALRASLLVSLANDEILDSDQETEENSLELETLSSEEDIDAGYAQEDEADAIEQGTTELETAELQLEQTNFTNSRFAPSADFNGSEENSIDPLTFAPTTSNQSDSLVITTISNQSDSFTSPESSIINAIPIIRQAVESTSITSAPLRHIPSLLISSPAPLNLQAIVNPFLQPQSEAPVNTIPRQKRRCLKRHSQNPSLACMRTDCKGSVNQRLCETPEEEFRLCKRAKKPKKPSLQ
jgi:hypothetical protein